MFLSLETEKLSSRLDATRFGFIAASFRLFGLFELFESRAEAKWGGVDVNAAGEMLEEGFEHEERFEEESGGFSRRSREITCKEAPRPNVWLGKNKGDFRIIIHIIQ